MVAFSARAVAQNADAGKIIAARVRGDVSITIKATNVTTPLANNGAVAHGAIVTTAKGSSVVLVFSNGATVNLGSDTALDIEQFTQDPFSTAFNAAAAKVEPSASTTKLKLVHGDLVSKVAKLNAKKGSTFTVATPVGAAGIRGTVFRIVYIPDGLGHASFKLTTLEGNVVVTLASGTVNAPPVEVAAGKEVTADVNVDASGNVTVVLPAGTTAPVAATASSDSTAAVAASAADIAQATVNTVIPAAAAAATTSPVGQTTPFQPVDTSVVSPSH